MTTKEMKTQLEAICEQLEALRAELDAIGATQDELQKVDKDIECCCDKIRCCELIIAAAGEERAKTKAEFMADRYNAGYYNGIQADEDCCPCCKSYDIENIQDERDGNEIGYYYECKKCGLGYYIWYKLQYIEHCGFIDTEEA